MPKPYSSTCRRDKEGARQWCKHQLSSPISRQPSCSSSTFTISCSCTTSSSSRSRLTQTLNN